MVSVRTSGHLLEDTGRLCRSIAVAGVAKRNLPARVQREAPRSGTTLRTCTHNVTHWAFPQSTRTCLCSYTSTGLQHCPTGASGGLHQPSTSRHCQALPGLHQPCTAKHCQAPISHALASTARPPSAMHWQALPGLHQPCTGKHCQVNVVASISLGAPAPAAPHIWWPPPSDAVARHAYQLFGRTGPAAARKGVSTRSLCWASFPETHILPDTRLTTGMRLQAWSP